MIVFILTENKVKHAGHFFHISTIVFKGDTLWHKQCNKVFWSKFCSCTYGIRNNSADVKGKVSYMPLKF